MRRRRRVALMLLFSAVAGCHHSRVGSPVAVGAPENEATSPRNADSIAFLDARLQNGDSIERGKEQKIVVRIQYTLATRDRAILVLSLDQFRNRESCAAEPAVAATPAFLTPAEKEIEIARGTQMLEIPITWPGDTGDGTNGVIFGSGALSFRASMRTEFHYEFLTRRFGTEYCMRF